MKFLSKVCVLSIVKARKVNAHEDQPSTIYSMHLQYNNIVDFLIIKNNKSNHGPAAAATGEAARQRTIGASGKMSD